MTAKHERIRNEKLRQKALALKAAGFSSRVTAQTLKISQTTVVRLWLSPKPQSKLTLSFEELTEGQQNQVLRFREYDNDGEIERQYIENIAQFRLKKMRQTNVRNRNH